MQKVDIAIGVMGAVALLATGLGIALYDDINGLTHYDVEEATTAINEPATDVPTDGLAVDLLVPDNVYHAMLDIKVDFASQNPSLSGNVDVSVKVTTPDGQVTTETGTFAFGDGTGTVSVIPGKWGNAPASFDGTNDDVEANTLMSSEPLKVEITVQGPAGQLPFVTQDDATYSATITGEWHGYTISAPTPEPETA